MFIAILQYALVAFYVLLELVLLVCVIAPQLTLPRAHHHADDDWPTSGQEVVEFAALLRSLPESSRTWVIEHLKLANAWTEHPSIEQDTRGVVVTGTGNVSEYEVRSADGSICVRYIEVADGGSTLRIRSEGRS